MELISDGVLILAALTAALYCMILSRRLRRLTRTDGGLGEAIGAMSRRVDELQETLRAARTANEAMAERLREEIAAAGRAREELTQTIERASLLSEGSAPEAFAPPSAPRTPAPEGRSAARSAPPPEAVGPATPKRKDRARKPELDGLISAYLDAHSGESEEQMAERLVSALAARPVGWGGRT